MSPSPRWPRQRAREACGVLRRSGEPRRGDARPSLWTPRVDGIRSTVHPLGTYRPSDWYRAAQISALREHLFLAWRAPAQKTSALSPAGDDGYAVARARSHVRCGALALLRRRQALELRGAGCSCGISSRRRPKAVHGGPPSHKRVRVGCMVSALHTSPSNSASLLLAVNRDP